MRIITESADTVEQKNLAKALEALGLVVVANSEPQVMNEGLVRPCEKLWFNFEVVSKHDVMMTFLTMYEHGQLSGTKDALQRFLATHSNLGTKESIHKLYVRCLHEYVRKGH